MSSTHLQPRRRAAGASDSSVASHTALPRLPTKASWSESSTILPLQKGATFHQPSLPSTQEDPKLDVARLPRRSPTSPQALEDLLARVDKKVEDLLKTFDQRIAISAPASVSSSSDKDADLPVPAVFLSHTAASECAETAQHSCDLLDIKDQAAQRAFPRDEHNHDSDSGIGTSVSGSAPSSPILKAKSVYASLTGDHSTSISSRPRVSVLSDFAVNKIKQLVVKPLLAEEKLKDFHPLVQDLPRRIGARRITCLRDLEKTLVLLAPARSKDPAAYLTFCETAVQCVHTTVDHLNDRDLRRPTDKPYTNNYFVDLIEQIRQYARIMEAYRIKRNAGKAPAKKDYSPGEKLILQGGLSNGGKPLELVREQDGAMMSIDVEKQPDEEVDDDLERSMARKRKCDIGKEEIRACRECGKEFKRPCDLTKHEKTHSRPWKCPHASCKYNTLGWPTEKECDRHVNDKHSNTPLLYRCLYKPCAYTSKRESNCKQHMEKAHGWEYVRSKSKKGQSLVPTAESPFEAGMPTPSSGKAFPRLTPATDMSNSPALSSLDAFSPAASLGTGISGSSRNSLYQHSLMEPNYTSPEEDASLHGFDFGDWEFPADRHPSSDTHNTGISMDTSLPSSTFESTLDFGGAIMPDGSAWPVMGEWFTGYAQPGIQQPTPNYSDYEFSKDMATIDPQIGAVYADPQVVLNTPEDDCNSMEYKGAEADFPLFGEIGPQNGESSAMGAAVAPALQNFGTVGGQFEADPMFESMADSAMHDFTNHESF